MATLSKHWLAVVVAALIGLFCILPWIFFALSPEYAGVALVGPKDEEHYVARIEQVYAGHPTLSNVFLSQKDQPYFQPALGENVVAGLGKISGVSAPQITVASKFLFPFLAALLVYAFVYALFGSTPVALIAVLCFFFADNLTSGTSSWFRLFHGESPGGFLPFTRPVNPEISALFLFGALYILYRGFLERAVARTWEIIAAGLLIGGSLYISPYGFMFLVLFCVIWFIGRLWQRDYASALPMVYVGSITFLTIIPFLLNYRLLIADPNYADTAARFGLFATHAPIIGLWSVLLIICPLLFWPKEYAQAKWFFFISGISVLLLINQQVITGHIVQQNHYHLYITKPLADIMLSMYAVWVVALIARRGTIRTVLYICAALFLFYNGALIQYQSYTSAYPATVASQRYAPTLSYLEHLPTEETVWADRTLSLYIPMYTKHSVPNNYYASSYLTSNHSMVQRVLLEYRLRGVLPAEIAATMLNDRADISRRVFQLYWRDTAGSYAAIPETLLQDYAAEYALFFQKPYREALRDMGITLVAWDRTAEPQWKMDAMPLAEKIFESGDIAVYRLQ